ncbi:disabled homolog 1 isoform X2 [Aplysia californica]|uniref:Disabled homolog 1 isoform X2 n=1 Tax=Aplysia californica TaxID=6500 RepID=A0ABM1A6T4_APLCA|nr:disabled homolog 1 isoform X2 [Aplysia californica]
MTTKAKKGQNDPSRFEGTGISYKAKLIGVETVPEARGDQMCQEAITKLKNSVKISGQHKQKIFVNVTLEGLKIIDAISLPHDTESKLLSDVSSKKFKPHLVLHTHPVHRISFISRDTVDNRAFGYIFGEGDGSHKFFAIKTAAAAEQLVLALRDLFQVVYEMKKKEVEEAKEKIEKGEISVETENLENSQPSGDGSTSGTGQTPQTQSADAENIYQVPPNNAPVNPAAQAEEVANLLDLEDQAEHILKGIEQIKNLEFDSIGEEPTTSPVSPPTSPFAKLAPPSAAAPGQADPWGSPAPAAAAGGAQAPTSALGDLAGLQTSPFPNISMNPGFQQPQPGFPGTPFPGQGFGGQPQFGLPAGGLPVTKDPFANDPFRAGAQPGAVPPAGGFHTANPFGTQAFGGQQQAFGMQQPRPGAPVAPMAMMPGILPHGMMGQPQPGVMANPFAAQQQQQQPQQLTNAFGEENPNLLMPIRQDGGAQDGKGEADQTKARSKSPREDLFGDLLDIKKTAPPAAKTPKDMFAQISAGEKKSMNQLKTETTGQQPPPAAQASDPFGDVDSIAADKTRSLFSNEADEDPFDTSHIPSLPPAPQPSQQTSQKTNTFVPTDAVAPPVPRRNLTPNVPPDSQPNSSSSSPASPLFSPPLSSMPSSNPPQISPPPRPGKSNSRSVGGTPVHQPSTSIKQFKISESPDSSFSACDTSINNSFMLPSPDEPPPPLPSLPNINAPPPPPPRPKSSASSTASPLPSEMSSPHLRHSSSNQSVESKVSDQSSVKVISGDSAAPGHRDSRDKQAKQNGETKTTPLKNNSPFDPDPFCVPIRSSSSKKQTVTSSSTHSSSTSSSSSNNQSIPSTSDPFSPENFGFPKSDPFSSSQSILESDSSKDTSFGDTPATKSDGEDPFGLPLHLTPGFKVTAKFGNDPFEDSFNGSLGNNAEKWDPFASGFDGELPPKSSNDTDPWGSSPFGNVDAFGAPPQPVNGNSTGQTLLD